MDKKIEEEGLRHIANIEHQLGAIKRRSPSSKRAFKYGIFQGMGAVIGSILAVALLGVVLSIFGVIPGFVHLAAYLQGIMAHNR